MSENASPHTPESLVGSALGSYRLVRLLGSGGMGSVYEGLHPVIGARVAIKVLLPEVANNPSIVERFFNEARAVNLIGHRNLVKILDLAADRGRYYCVMELLDGEPLSKRLAPGLPMPLSEAAPILLQVADALQAAHERAIVHRDVKPDNLFLVAEGGRKDFVKVLDFGIAKLSTAGLDVERTAAGMVMGTPNFMSPEQAEGAVEKIDGRSDIYSLGVVMFQMATGVLPFRETTHMRTMMAHVSTQPPRPRSIAPSIPLELERIILRCLAKEREERFQTMRDLKSALEAAVAGPVEPSWMSAPSKPSELSELSKPSEPAASAITQLHKRSERSSPAPASEGLFVGGLSDEPLPGAEMFEPRSEKFEVETPALPTPPPIVRAKEEEAPLELDLPAPPAPLEETAAAAPAPRPRRGPLVAAAVGALIVATGAALFLARSSSSPAGAPQAEMSCPAHAAAAIAQAIDLQVVTIPPAASVRAQWSPSGCVIGTTPFHFSAPLGAQVHLRYQLAGFPPREADEQASSPHVILESLSQ